ncbi:type II secretion system F family protein [Sphingorhabdus arenilitoris]|uniref:Type II secretion system F family protein n=1 Tax=Sphingorhabdus arenilitoris TaxID=1490041 RepID=A0ABV8RFL7_9SPHN
MNMQMMIVVIGMILCLALLVLAFAGPSSAKASMRRMGALKLRHSDSDNVRVEAQMKKAIASRRPMVYTQGQDISRADRLRLRIAQTGKQWTLQQYLYASLALGVVVAGLIIVKGAPVALGAAVGLLMALGVPHMVIGFLINKRLNNFTSSFPDAIELLVRGLKSGLPVGETLMVVAKEIPGPVGEEFKLVTEKIKIGKPMEDALQETADRLGTPEFQFFVITLAIQRETGGNLAETLANLADVLRKRAQMKLKIRAMSSESKASAYIVGSLPFFVFGMVWTVNPEYLYGFVTFDEADKFFEPRLLIAGLIGMVWMGIGVGIMAKMVSFEI